MPFVVVWDNEDHTVIRTETHGYWTWDEYHRALDAALDMMTSVEHTVDIINVRLPGSVTPSGNPLPHLMRASRIYPAHHRMTINVGSNTIGRSLTKVFLRLFPQFSKRLMIADSLEEARALIAELDAKQAARIA